MKDRILITGGTGFIGSNFIEKFKYRYEFLVITRDSTQSFVDSVQFIDGKKLTLDAIKDFNPSYLIHLAASTIVPHSADSIKALIQSNIEFPSIVADYFVSAGGKSILNIGTFWQHMNNKEYSPNSFYAATKKSFEDILQFYVDTMGTQVITLKLFDTYGPNDPRRKILKLVHEASKSGEPLELSGGEQLINMTHIDDVANAIDVALSAFKKGHHTYLAKSRPPLPLKTIIQTFCEVNQLEVDLRWAIREYSKRDFFQEINIFPTLPEWHEKIELKLGLKNLYLN